MRIVCQQLAPTVGEMTANHEATIAAVRTAALPPVTLRADHP